MFYSAHLDDSNNMAHNSEKDVQASSFGDYYDMDSEVNYQDLFIAQPDQAVVSKVKSYNQHFSMCLFNFFSSKKAFSKYKSLIMSQILYHKILTGYFGWY